MDSDYPREKVLLNYYSTLLHKIYKTYCFYDLVAIEMFSKQVVIYVVIEVVMRDTINWDVSLRINTISLLLKSLENSPLMTNVQLLLGIYYLKP